MIANIDNPKDSKSKEYEDLAKNFDKKLESMESQIVHLRKSLEEKDSTINDLTKKMKILEDKVDDISINDELESKLKSQETKLKTISSTLSKLEKIAKRGET